MKSSIKAEQDKIVLQVVAHALKQQGRKRLNRYGVGQIFYWAFGAMGHENYKAFAHSMKYTYYEE